MIPENITLPKIVSREECKKLLKDEKEFTWQHDDLNAKRRGLANQSLLVTSRLFK